MIVDVEEERLKFRRTPVQHVNHGRIRSWPRKLLLLLLLLSIRSEELSYQNVGRALRDLVMVPFLAMKIETQFLIFGQAEKRYGHLFNDRKFPRLARGVGIWQFLTQVYTYVTLHVFFYKITKSESQPEYS